MLHFLSSFDFSRSFLHLSDGKTAKKRTRRKRMRQENYTATYPCSVYDCGMKPESMPAYLAPPRDCPPRPPTLLQDLTQDSATLTADGAADQTVRGGENDCFIWSGNFLAQVPIFSGIFPGHGIFRKFT